MQTTLVDLRRKPDGVWEMRWQAQDGNIRVETGNSAGEVARHLLRVGNFEFVRGLTLPTE